MPQTIKEIGEQGLLSLLKPFCSDRMGDDAALMGETLPNHEMVVTTDVLIENVHFSETTTSAFDVGWRAAAVNLSDLAAMGAQPWGAVIGLGLPPSTSVDWVIDVYRGFSTCLETYGAELVGGDTVRSPVISLSVTVFGQVLKSQAIQRHTALVGDLIVITGVHGLSKAGLELLLQPDLQQKAIQLLSLEAIASLYCSHQRPLPRLDVPPLIWQIYESKSIPVAERRITGMDSSDGLADAILQICRASQVSVQIDWSAIPIPDAIKLLAGNKALDWILYGGEDFELVLSLPKQIAETLTQTLTESAIIGEVIRGNCIDGLDMQRAFQHFGNSKDLE